MCSSDIFIIVPVSGSPLGAFSHFMYLMAVAVVTVLALGRHECTQAVTVTVTVCNVSLDRRKDIKR